MEIVYTIQKQLTVKVTQSCLTLCDPLNYIVRGILEARILEWVAISSSNITSRLYKVINKNLSQELPLDAAQYIPGQLTQSV